MVYYLTLGMSNLLSRIHTRVGDLWWYSAMIFIACRSGDVIQAFIGLWLVPKYVGPQELGAVLPLQQLTSFLTVPLAVIAVVFSKYVNTYATRGEYGKVKSFIKDVFTVSIALFIVCVGGAYLIAPFFYERLRIASGSLTFLILLCGLVTNLGSIIASAQQGLKRFKTMSVMTFISAPIRLVTLIFAMPFRALSGYMLGQTTPAATTAALSIFDIRKTLKPYTADKSWRKDLPAIGRYLWPFALCTIVGSFAGTLTATIYRQRLPEVESAAYYLLTRFSDIASFAGASLSLILFPMASEAHEKGKENRQLLWHSVFGTIGGSVLLAAVFFVIAEPLLSLSSLWRQYLPYAYLLPILTINVGPGLAAGAIANYELACHRIGATVLLVIMNTLFALLLVAITGCEFFRGIAPDSAVDWMRSLQLAKLSTLTYLTTSFSLVMLSMLAVYTRHSTRKRTHHEESH